MMEFAENVGLTVIAIVFLAMPALLVLSIMFNWGIVVTILLVGMIIIEILLFVLVVGELADDYIL